MMESSPNADGRRDDMHLLSGSAASGKAAATGGRLGL
jgi:hypothetical protein